MSISFRRLSMALLATFLLGSFAAEEAIAQGLSTGPAGGIGSTTAPSNGEGTPSGGTGTVGSTRVGPSTTATAAPARRAPRRSARRTTRRAAPAS